MSKTPTLARSIGRTPLIFYGVGTMVGAGFYALIGRVSGLAGMSAPAALVFAGLLALISAASFAELSSRFPVSAGEVRYVEEGSPYSQPGHHRRMARHRDRCGLSRHP